MRLSEDALSIPNPNATSDKLELTYDMKRIYLAESRIHEMAFVTASKASELLTILTLALGDLGNHLADLSYRESVAARTTARRRAVVLMEVIPVKLAEKKLSNNDANREAVIELDPEYAVLCDIEDQIKAAFILVREKLRTVETAINNIKKTLDTNAMLSFRQNPDLNVQNGLTIGKARY